jgi:hypothetical protein
MGQWPESMSTSSSFSALASSVSSPAVIHSWAWAGLNSGQTRTTGTPCRRSSVRRTTPVVTASGTGIAAAANGRRATSSRSADSGPSKGSQPGNGMTPSTVSKKPA